MSGNFCRAGDRSTELTTRIRGVTVSTDSHPLGASTGLSALPTADEEQPVRVSLNAASQRRLVRAIRQHHALVWRTLRRFGVPERDVEDAAQHVLLQLVSKLEAVENEAAFLVAVAVRVAANARRKLERSPEVLSDETSAQADGATPETLLREKQLRQQLDRALAGLPLEQRAVFVMYELEGFTLPEIAEALQLPLGTATSRLRRARVAFEAWVASRQGEER